MDYKKYNDYELIYMVHENDEVSTNLLLKKYYPIIFKLSHEYYNKYYCSGYELDDFYYFLSTFLENFVSRETFCQFVQDFVSRETFKSIFVVLFHVKQL